jgi:hypothetical protein
MAGCTTRYSGSQLYFSFAAQQISGGQREMSYTQDLNMIDAGAGSDPWMIEVPGRKSGDITISFLETGTAGTPLWAAVEIGEYGTALWGPLGTASGNPKGGVTARVTSNERVYPYEDMAMRTITFRQCGTPLFVDSTDTW